MLRHIEEVICLEPKKVLGQCVHAHVTVPKPPAATGSPLLCMHLPTTAVPPSTTRRLVFERIRCILTVDFSAPESCLAVFKVLRLQHRHHPPSRAKVQPESARTCMPPPLAVLLSSFHRLGRLPFLTLICISPQAMSSP